MDNTLDTSSDAPLVNVTYARTVTRVMPMHRTAQNGVRTQVVQDEDVRTSENLTIEVAATASVSVRVSTDKRGTVRWVKHHRCDDPPAGPDLADFCPRRPWPLQATPAPAAGLTLDVPIDCADTLVHVSVVDLSDLADRRAVDRFIKLAELRTSDCTPNRLTAWPPA